MIAVTGGLGPHDIFGIC